MFLQVLSLVAVFLNEGVYPTIACHTEIRPDIEYLVTTQLSGLLVFVIRMTGLRQWHISLIHWRRLRGPELSD